jgi:hypothetical protein
VDLELAARVEPELDPVLNQAGDPPLLGDAATAEKPMPVVSKMWRRMARRRSSLARAMASDFRSGVMGVLV